MKTLYDVTNTFKQNKRPDNKKPVRSFVGISNDRVYVVGIYEEERDFTLSGKVINSCIVYFSKESIFEIERRLEEITGYPILLSPSTDTLCKIKKDIYICGEKEVLESIMYCYSLNDKKRDKIVFCGNYNINIIIKSLRQTFKT